MAHLLAADVDPRDLAAVALGDAQRRRPDTTAHIKHELPRLQMRHLGDQVGVRVERLRQRLATRAEVTEMEVVAVEQARVVGDQVEVRADAGRGSSSPHQDRQRQLDRRRQFACGTRRTSVAPSGHEHLSWHLLRPPIFAVVPPSGALPSGSVSWRRAGYASKASAPRRPP